MGKLVLGVVPWLFVCAPNSRRYQSRQKLLNRSGAVWCTASCSGYYGAPGKPVTSLGARMK
jgi:hypothetical protein